MSWLTPEHERFLAEREYAERRAAERSAELAAARTRHKFLQRREGLIAAALEASSRAHAKDTPEIRMMIDAVIGMALAAPEVEIRWLRPATRASKLMGSNAMASGERPLVITQAITGERDLATCLHELGHHRTRPVRGRINGEVRAWEWAATHAPCWTQRMHDWAVESLETYLANAKRGILHVEGAMGVDTFAARFHALQKPLALAVRQFQERRFAQIHGAQRCPCGRPAVRSVGRTYQCLRCRDAAEVDARFEKLKRWRQGQTTTT